MNDLMYNGRIKLTSSKKPWPSVTIERRCQSNSFRKLRMASVYVFEVG